jgi:DDE superfamily endonuclease
MTPKVTRLDYCQFLLSSQTNYTLTYFAEHRQSFSHDSPNRYLGRERITARMVWEQTKAQIVQTPQGYLVFDDTVVDKNDSRKIELVRRQWSGNEKRVIRGIGVVNCVYVNPETGQFWVVDYRIYAPDQDGKSKLDHVREMLLNAIHHKQLQFRGVLMDSWYAERTLMLLIERINKVFYCPLKCNRRVDESDGTHPYVRVDELKWSEDDTAKGKTVHIKDFPKGHRVKLFRLVLSTERTDFVATNDVEQDSTQGARDVCALRWPVEQFHREAKQVTGIDACQCRTARIQRNHIACAILVWIHLKKVASQTKKTIYQLKQGLLDDYMRKELASPRVKMAFA